MFRSFSNWGGIVGLILLCSLSAGCGSDGYATATVTGTVTCNGKPAHGGVITFRPVDAPAETGRPAGHPGRVAFATVQEDGSFTMLMDTAANVDQASGALIGPHEVFFQPPRTQPWKPTAEERGNMTPAELVEYQKELDQLPVYKPLACGTGITPDKVTVEPGTNKFEFTLK